VSGALEQLQTLLLGQGGLLATLLTGGAVPSEQTSRSRRTPGSEWALTHSPSVPGPARIAAAGPRTRARALEYEMLVEAIYEGYLLHYGAPRLLHPPDPDLGLLAGDQLYALGLAQLVALGDLTAVAELADVITLSALAQGAGREELAQAIWMAGARAVGWGSSEPHRRAKALTRADERGALEVMREAAAGP
jgi:hypothetical protein